MNKKEIDEIVEMLSKHPSTITCPLPQEYKKTVEKLCDDIETEMKMI